MDVGCYCVNISRTALAAEPVEVQAVASWAPSGVDDRLFGTLRFDNDIVAQFDCALSIERRESYEIVGTDGSLFVPVAFCPAAAKP